MARGVRLRPASRPARTSPKRDTPCLLALALLAACSDAAEPGLPPAETLAEQRIQYDADDPKSILELQPWRSQSRAAVRRADGSPGVATLTNLNPYVNFWYLLSIEWPGSAGRSAYHLENTHPGQAPLQLRADNPTAIVIAGAGGRLACTVWRNAAPGELDEASASGLPYAPLCGGALYLRNPVAGHHTSLERLTDFLRDHVWGGDRIVNLVKEQLYRDAFLENRVAGAAQGPPPPLLHAPTAAAVAPEAAARTIVPQRLALELAGAVRELLPGRWYGARDLAGVTVSVVAPEDLDSQYRLAHEAHVNLLDSVESQALAYLVAFDLERFDLHFVLGTDHPRLDWSDRPPPAERDPRLPGPDGVGSAAPLVTNGMVDPLDADRTIAAFIGGFKRIHGAFRSGPFALRNHGSHYGFIEQGVIFSKLQPGLATALVMDDGAVGLRTWTADDNSLLPHIRYARQNGVPLVEYDAQRHAGVPGELVNAWGPGNWSGSAEEVLRTLRAGMCLQEHTQGRFLIYGYFSAATPSAMTRVFQAYGCRYAMILDINALEHTYLALYVHRAHQRVVEHLIEGMEEVDRSAGGEFVPRFLGFPDDRDFFYFTQREASP